MSRPATPDIPLLYETVGKNNQAGVTFFKDTFDTTPAGSKLFTDTADLFAFFSKPPLQREEKNAIPLYTRSLCEGSRAKKHGKGALLVILDIDSYHEPLEAVSQRLDRLGIDHLAHTSWSQGKKDGQNFRVLTDMLCPDWPTLRAVTQALAARLEVPIAKEGQGGLDPASWASQAFYLPAAHPDRADLYVTKDVLTEEGTLWKHGKLVVTAPKSGDLLDGEIDVAEVTDALTFVDPTDYALWIEIGQALHSTGAEKALEIWDQWSSTGGKYEAGVCAGKWETFDGKGGVTLGTLFHHALEGGWKPAKETPLDAFADQLTVDPEDGMARAVAPVGEGELISYSDKTGKPFNTVENVVLMVKSLELGLAYDDLGNKTRMLGPGVEDLERSWPKVGRVYEDAVGLMIQHRIAQRFGIDLSQERIREAVTKLARSNRFNPVEMWLRSLKWDGVRRLDGWLTTYCGVEKTPYADAVGNLFLKAAVARAFVPGIKFDSLVVFEGKQGTFKSSMLAVLGGEYSLEGIHARDLRDRDVVAQLQGKWIVELDELEAARKADAQSLKSFLSRTVDTARLAYERDARDFPRRCVFAGTTNESTYLKDETGNRRILPVVITCIDIEAVKRDKDQIFAEAVVAWLSNPSPESLVLDQSLWAHANEEQEKRRMEHPWEEVLERYLATGGEDGEPLKVVSTKALFSLALGLDEAKSRPSDSKQLRSIMERLGWEYGKFRDGGTRFRGYRYDAGAGAYNRSMD
jgi:hypothetical protein